MMSNINPSDWIVNQVEFITKNNQIPSIIDIASGDGRHSTYFANKGYNILSIDNDFKKLKSYSNFKNINTICFDLENDNFWPISITFDIVLVVNYLYRKNFKNILKLVKKNGYLIYETFCVGNEKYGKPSNPDYLLKNNELKNLITERFVIKRFYQGLVENNIKSYKQMFLAKRVA